MLSIDQNGIANVGTDLLFLTSFEAATVYMSTHIRHHFVTALSSLFRLHHPARKTFRSPELQVVRLGESSKPQRLKGKGWHAAAAVSQDGGNRSPWLVDSSWITARSPAAIDDTLLQPQRPCVPR
jgi:hypothetical protein